MSTRGQILERSEKMSSAVRETFVRMWNWNTNRRVCILIKIYRTDEDGTIQIISDGTQYEVVKINQSFNGN